MNSFVAFTLLFLATGCNGLWHGKPLEEDFGYVEVRRGANLFYVAYHVDQPGDYTEYPLIIWLQGGPGASGVGLGNFGELGPYSIEDQMKKRQFAWTKVANVMFVDSPVGVGYSYVADDSLLCTNNSQIALDLVTLMQGLYHKHPAYARMPLHIVSESYGGKMAADFARAFDETCKAGDVPCNLRSVTLGDSWISPIDYVEIWGPYLYNLGMVNRNGLAAIQSAASATRAAVDAGQWAEATQAWGQAENQVMQESASVSFYNVLEKNGDPFASAPQLRANNLVSKPRSLYRQSERLRNFSGALNALMNGQLKTHWGVPQGLEWEMSSGPVFQALSEDFMRPVVDTVAHLLDHTDIKVNVINGNLDLICATPGTYKWLEGMQWSGAASLSRAPHSPFFVPSYSSPAGFVDAANNLTVYVVLRAGHMVPMDAPEEALKVASMIIES